MMMMMDVNQMLAFCFFIFLTFSVSDLTSFTDIVWKAVSVTVSV